MMGMPREILAAFLNMPVDRLRKCEGGADRFSSVELARIADMLDVTPAYFSDGIDPDRGAPGAQRPIEMSAECIGATVYQLFGMKAQPAVA